MSQVYQSRASNANWLVEIAKYCSFLFKGQLLYHCGSFYPNYGSLRQWKRLIKRVRSPRPWLLPFCWQVVLTLQKGLCKPRTVAAHHVYKATLTPTSTTDIFLLINSSPDAKLRLLNGLFSLCVRWPSTKITFALFLKPIKILRQRQGWMPSASRWQ